MRIAIKVKPRSKAEKVQKLNDDERRDLGVDYIISVRERPAEGKANTAVIRAIAAYFDVPRMNVRIAAGLESRKKIVDIAYL